MQQKSKTANNKLVQSRAEEAMKQANGSRNGKRKIEWRNFVLNNSSVQWSSDVFIDVPFLVFIEFQHRNRRVNTHNNRVSCVALAHILFFFFRTLVMFNMLNSQKDMEKSENRFIEWINARQSQPEKWSIQSKQSKAIVICEWHITEQRTMSKCR